MEEDEDDRGSVMAQRAQLRTCCAAPESEWEELEQRSEDKGEGGDKRVYKNNSTHC